MDLMHVVNAGADLAGQAKMASDRHPELAPTMNALCDFIDCLLSYLEFPRERPAEPPATPTP